MLQYKQTGCFHLQHASIHSFVMDDVQYMMDIMDENLLSQSCSVSFAVTIITDKIIFFRFSVRAAVMSLFRLSDCDNCEVKV